MKKNIKNQVKRGLTFGLISVMSLAMLSGCGSKKAVKNDNSDKSNDKAQTQDVKTSDVDIELNELLSNVVISVADIEKIKMGLNGEIAMSGESDGVDIIVNGGVSLNGIVSVDEPKFNLDGSINYELGTTSDKFSGEHSITAYGETEDGELFGYFKLDDEEWMKDKEDISGYTNGIEELKNSIEDMASTISELDFSELEEFEEYIRLESETQIVDGVECYVISANINKESLMALGEEYGADMDEMQTDLEMINDFSLEIGLFFAKDTYVPVKFAFDATMSLEESGEEVNVDKFSFEITLGVNTDDEIESVPSDVKASAIATEDADISVGDLLY